MLASPTREMHPNVDDGLFWVLFAACTYTLNLSVLGRFCRGGITVGPLYIDDRYVTGNALVEAVRIEQDVARHPRVVLDAECVELALRELASPGEDPFDGPYNRYLLYDADGDHVIANYLAALNEDDQYDETAVSLGLQRHAAAIEKAESEAGDFPRIREKYGWLRGYHNFVATTFFGRSDLRVDGPVGDLRLVVPSRHRPRP